MLPEPDPETLLDKQCDPELAKSHSLKALQTPKFSMSEVQKRLHHFYRIKHQVTEEQISSRTDECLDFPTHDFEGTNHKMLV